jgi:hypothetical protein
MKAQDILESQTGNRSATDYSRVAWRRTFLGRRPES